MSESFIIISPPPRLRWLGSVPTPRFNEPSPTAQWGSREGQIASQDNTRPLAESRSRRQRKPAKVDRDKLACPPNPVRATRDPPIYAARPTPPNSTSSQLVTRSNPLGAPAIGAFLVFTWGRKHPAQLAPELLREHWSRRSQGDGLGCQRDHTRQDEQLRRDPSAATRARL